MRLDCFLKDGASLVMRQEERDRESKNNTNYKQGLQDKGHNTWFGHLRRYQEAEIPKDRQGYCQYSDSKSRYNSVFDKPKMVQLRNSTQAPRQDCRKARQK